MAVYYATKSYVLSFGRAIGRELRDTGVTITTLCPGATTSEFAQVANMRGSALFEGPVPVMTAAEVARQGYAALKAGRPQIITGPVNRFHADGDLVDDCWSSQPPRKRAEMSSLSALRPKGDIGWMPTLCHDGHALPPLQAKFLRDHFFYVENRRRASKRRFRIVRHSFQRTLPIAEAFQAIRIRK
jgi:hypothetical protein